MIRHPSKRLLILILLLLCAVPFATTSAQEVIPIEYGTTVVNRLPAEGSTIAYTFNGNVGDLVTIRAVGISPGADPTLSLVGPPEQVLAINDNVLSIPFSTAAQIVFRLQASGPHFIVVGGTPGDFFMTLESRPATPLIILQLDTPVTVSFPVTDPAQSFVFNTDPVFATTLLIDASPFTLDAYVEVRDGTGQIISTLRSNLDSTCISVGPGDQLLEMTIVALPEVTGTITLTVSNASCALGPVPAEPPVFPTAEFTPAVVEGVCTASSSRNVNIRSGPGTNYARLALLQAREPIQVTGQSENGQWFVVQNEFIQGWMAASVIRVTGPCTQLPVVAAPPLPAASATPGFPVIVVQPPIVITTTPLGTLPPVVVTATPGPQVPTNTPPAPPATVTPAPTVAAPTLTPTLTPTATPTV
jgi:uncharacterized protein YraI